MRPCTNCVYLHVCGDSRSELCNGRQTKTEKQKEFAKMVDDLYEERLGFENLDKSYIANLIKKHGYNRAREILFEKQFA